jgi:hypothetical protein
MVGKSGKAHETFSGRKNVVKIGFSALAILQILSQFNLTYLD